MKNYYKILEVSENASIEVIEKAYKVLVKKYHPDLQKNNPDAEKKIKEINEAYGILSDSFLKEQYDKELLEEKKSNTENNFQETDYGRLYRENEKLKYQLAYEKYGKVQRNKKTIQEKELANNTSYDGIIDIIGSVFKHRPKLQNIKNIKRLDIIALLITIAIVITLGVILYILPFTHDWMNRNFIDTPLINWIKGLF